MTMLQEQKEVEQFHPLHLLEAGQALVGSTWPL